MKRPSINTGVRPLGFFKQNPMPSVQLVRLAPGEFWLTPKQFALMFPAVHEKVKDRLQGVGTVELADGTLVHLVEDKQ